MPQIAKKYFIEALKELGHNPNDYMDKKLSLESMSELYSIQKENIIDAIDDKKISAHYDYKKESIWIDALEAAYFYFCVQNEAHLYSPNP